MEPNQHPLVSGSRFIRWTLVPCLVLFAGAMAVLAWEGLLAPEATALQLALTIVLAILALLAALGLSSPRRFRWALRMVAGSIFGLYLTYFISETLIWSGVIQTAPAPGFASPAWAAVGCILIGLPCLLFALRGGSPGAELPGGPTSYDDPAT